MYNFIFFLKFLCEARFITQASGMRKMRIGDVQGFVDVCLALRMWKPHNFIFLHLFKQSYTGRKYIQILICVIFSFPFLQNGSQVVLGSLCPQGHFRCLKKAEDEILFRENNLLISLLFSQILFEYLPWAEAISGTEWREMRKKGGQTHQYWEEHKIMLNAMQRIKIKL